MRRWTILCTEGEIMRRWTILCTEGEIIPGGEEQWLVQRVKSY